MKRTLKSSAICVLLVLSLVMFASCKRKVETDPEAGAAIQAPVAEDTETADNEAAEAAVRAEEEAKAAEAAATAAEEEKREAELLQLREDFETAAISFEYDSSAIMDAEIATLEAKAEWLRDNTDVTITIEGHCDERGTTEYNLALGDRRAARVKSFLTNLGIDAERITTISYGEERPAVSGHDEAAWSQNRRAKCVID